MTVIQQCLLAATISVAIMATRREAMGQLATSPTPAPSPQVQSFRSPSASLTPNGLSPENADPALVVPAANLLFDFKNSDIKFNLQSLMNILRDNRHEGWVLAAYPDPNTGGPLIGAGFSLDVMATGHFQSDPLNPNLFLEPSSAQLWQAAGLDPERLQRILDQFDHDLKTWGKKTYRKKIRQHTLSPELTEEEATRLLRISVLEAVHNARAYCRDFDQLTAWQQMALTQLVFQMGVNLDEFVQFLNALNGDNDHHDLSQPGGAADPEVEQWKTVQRTLIESQWARRYTSRAATVIAMFDPSYVEDPSGNERRVETTIRPPAKHTRKRRPVHALRAGNDSNPVAKIPGKKTPASQSKRKLT